MSKRKKDTTYEFQHPRAQIIIEEGISFVRRKGGASEAEQLRRQIKLRELDIKLLGLYLPHADENDQARAQRTIAWLKSEIERMEKDLPYASERRAA